MREKEFQNKLVFQFIINQIITINTDIFIGFYFLIVYNCLISVPL